MNFISLVSEETSENIDASLDVTSIRSSSVQDAAVQTEIPTENFMDLQKKIKSLEEENVLLRKNIAYTRTYDMIVNSNQKIFKFYTGLYNVGLFNSLLTYLLSEWEPDVKVTLKPCEQLLLVLMKLRLGLLNQDLAFRFQIGLGTVSSIFHAWLNIMFVQLNEIIIWPSRKNVKKYIPQCFKDVTLENVRCIIDCTEIFIEKPHNFKARAQTYSNYKHHNTMKCLVGITPSGVICFISRAWGGRISDRQLTVKSGLLNLLENDDVVLADRGFKIYDVLAEKGAKLFIPSSTKNKSQLSAEEVRQSRNMSKVRVHIERAIRKIKTYKILESNVPISLIKKNGDEEFSTLDKIVLIICALCNLSNPIISQKFN